MYLQKILRKVNLVLKKTLACHLVSYIKQRLWKKKTLMYYQWQETPLPLHITHTPISSNLLTSDTDDSTTLLLSGMPVNPGGGLLTTDPRPGGGGGGGALWVLFNGNALLKPTNTRKHLWVGLQKTDNAIFCFSAIYIVIWKNTRSFARLLE